MALIPRWPDKDMREALLLLADAVNGCMQSILMAHGLAIGMLRELVRNGMATEERRTIRSGFRTIEVTWLTITADGE